MRGQVNSVDDIRARCVLDEDTGCWLPPSDTVRIYLNGKPMIMRWRRAGLVMARGEAIYPGYRVFPRSCCDTKECCNPAHSKSGSPKEWGKALRDTGRVKGLPNKVRAARANAPKPKTTPEQDREIALSDEPLSKIAERMGIAKYTAGEIRRGNRRPKPAASVFNWVPR